MLNNYLKISLRLPIPICMALILVLPGCSSRDKIDRHALVTRHNPQLDALDPNAPFTVGNGQFAFTADVSGLQSFSQHYFDRGIPLETKARWAWHSRKNPSGYQLQDASETYRAYGREVRFPTDMGSTEGQWLRKNPHDLPLARVALNYKNRSLSTEQLSKVQQKLNMWNGILTSEYALDSRDVLVKTTVASDSDTVAFDLSSELVSQQQLSITLDFPRGYDLGVKNTPDIIWQQSEAHQTRLVHSEGRSALFDRRVDDSQHWVMIQWQGEAALKKIGSHQYRLQMLGNDPVENSFSLTVQFSAEKSDLLESKTFAETARSAQSGWQRFWESGAAIDFSGSRAGQARELERRLVLSQYLMAAQERAAIPAQETGLTSSSWYGKFHTEMSWWHSAHWALWGREDYTKSVLDWYVEHLDVARETAKKRGLAGARWSKMIGPDGRESPGGNPLIIWNQPQPIELAELVYQREPTEKVLHQYAELVEETAQALSSMLAWEEQRQRYSLNPPIWIAQEHYDVSESKNPSFELSFWYTALKTAQRWRRRIELEPHPLWQKQIEKLAVPPHKDGKYVAIESVPDTFDNRGSRNDHPAMLAIWGLLEDDRVNPSMVRHTLLAVMQSWDFEERIWGWDYPMIAMTASRLNEPDIAVQALLMDAHNNHYNINGHCPQKKVGLPVYLPANGALLAAVAHMAARNPERETLGFPDNGQWKVRAEGFLQQ